ncbi:MAG: MgtC/SapB family protein [Armatimonadota bacterium]
MPELLVMSLKLILASILGGVVGFERERHEHPAGLRTHILVCMGSTLIMLISQSFGTVTDPSRIAAQIVSGIGFLGAGTILRQGSVVRGLTTAASLWTVAGIGMAVGLGGIFSTYSFLAVVATVIVFFTLSIARKFEPFMGKGSVHTISFEAKSANSGLLTDVLNNILGMKIIVESVQSVPSHIDGNRIWKLRILLPRNVKLDDVISMIASESDVERFELQ